MLLEACTTKLVQHTHGIISQSGFTYPNSGKRSHEASYQLTKFPLYVHIKGVTLAEMTNHNYE